jgi:hypothetical protein
VGVAAVAAAATAAPDPNQHVGGMSGIVPVRAAGKARTSNALLVYHNGPVMTAGASVTAVFWGTSWSNATAAGDKVGGIDTFYQGVGGTSYLHTNSEYTQSGGQHVGLAVSYGGHKLDLTSSGTKAPSTSDVLAVVARNVTSPVANGYYPVYSDMPRGNNGYCAWHSWGTIGTTPVQFAFFFRLDGDPGCDPGSTVSGQSQGLAALGNVSGHELSEALTDPRGSGWYDRTGAENSDKCAWTFGSTSVSFTNGSSWKIQGNFSNAAYGANAGYGPRGCIQTS